MKGVIKNLKPGFGFIRSEGAEADFFFLPSEFQNTPQTRYADLRVGQAVVFETQDHPRGARAVQVRLSTEN